MNRISLLLALSMLAAPAWACTAADTLKSRYGVTFSGFKADIARVAEPVQLDKLLAVHLEDDTRVYDGFHHTAYVDRTSKKAFILRTGGFIGVHEWYGPLDVRDVSFEGCEPVKVEPLEMRLPEVTRRKL